jgi:multidrug efflux pump
VISRFFIDRPIFAAVLSILITLAGGISVFSLPLAQFPSITPPTIQVTCNYPGANAQEVANAVAAPIEQQVNGVENMMFMSSQCANDGSYNLTVTFHHGIDINMAQVLVQNRVNLAVPLLPEVIRQTGVTTRKRSPDILCGLAIRSKNHRYDQLYLSNFALMQIKDELARLQGVGDVFLFGQQDYSMRLWLNPDKLAARKLSASDVVAAIREQNSQVASGSIGQEPMAGIQDYQLPLSTLGRLSEVEQFENIVIKTGQGRRLIRVKDVGRVELGPKNRDIGVRLDGDDTVFLAIFQMPDANALEVQERVMAKMAELQKGFPEGIDYEIGFDTTPYTRESIHEVVKTLRDAIILVAVVVLIFLQNWRSALIPLLAVPVAVIGTFAVMGIMGFSLNNLTLLGLILAIGIVVDDAIVVVEAVEHHIENGLEPRAATIKAMEQVSGPVIAVGLVLSAVFVPCAFISGITGQFFRQFAMTIAVSTVISAFNSLTLSPALTALLLRPRKKIDALQPSTNGVAAGRGVLASLRAPVDGFLAFCARLFNTGFGQATSGYVRLVRGLLRVSVVVLLVYGGLLALTYFRFTSTPRGFIPAQDMGYLMINVQLPDSASMERTDAVMRQIEEIALNLETNGKKGVRHVTGIMGQSFVLNAAGSNFGSLFLNLKPYEERRDPELSSDAIANQLRQEFAKKIDGAMVAVFGPPPVRGVGRAGGFSIMIEDRGDFGPQILQEQTDNLVRLANQPDKQQTPWLVGPDGKPNLMGLFTVFRSTVPQLRIEPNKSACMVRGVSMQDFSDTLQVYTGSLYVNDFNLFGRTWQVIVQAEENFRAKPESVPQLRVRNSRGAMVPLGSLADLRPVTGPLVLTRYNMYPAAAINGASAPGVSSRDTIDMLERLADHELRRNMSYEWTDMSYLELLAGNTAMVIFLCAVVMVFLVLAAQYESWSLPLAVILVVPMCLLSAITGVNIAGMDINIFTQIGFVVLVGLASKNAILIVEFAKQQRHHGQSRTDATLAACRLRLRPIVMTSLAFILGVLPLIMSDGAGAEMRRTLGTAVFSGMLGVTLFGIVLTPVFFYTIDWLGESRLLHSHALRRISDLALDVLALRSVRKVAGHAARVFAKRDADRVNVRIEKVKVAVSENGQGGEAEKGSQGDRDKVRRVDVDETAVVEQRS